MTYKMKMTKKNQQGPLMEVKYWGTQPWMKDILRWKTSFNRRHHSIEDILRVRTTCDGRGTLRRQLSRECKTLRDGNHFAKTTLHGRITLEGRQPFNGRWILTDVSFWLMTPWNTSFDERHALMKDMLWWRTNSNGSQPIFDGKQPLEHICKINVLSDMN